MPPDCPQLAEPLPAYRSRVTNGKDILPGVDGRSPVARRYRDLFQIFCEDAGGMDRLSEKQRQHLRRTAALAARCEQIEADMCNGDAVDWEDYRGNVNTLRRIAAETPLGRVARDVTPFRSLEDVG